MVSANGCHEILANDFSLAIGQQALTVGAGGFAFELLAHDAAGANEHQAVDQFAGAFCGGSAIDEHQGLLAGFGQVYGDGGTVTRCAGDQRVERGAPGVHRVGDQFDLLGHKLRLVGHGGDPLAGSCVG